MSELNWPRVISANAGVYTHSSQDRIALFLENISTWCGRNILSNYWVEEGGETIKAVMWLADRGGE